MRSFTAEVNMFTAWHKKTVLVPRTNCTVAFLYHSPALNCIKACAELRAWHLWLAWWWQPPQLLRNVWVTLPFFFIQSMIIGCFIIKFILLSTHLPLSFAHLPIEVADVSTHRLVFFLKDSRYSYYNNAPMQQNQSADQNLKLVL